MRISIAPLIFAVGCFGEAPGVDDDDDGTESASTTGTGTSTSPDPSTSEASTGATTTEGTTTPVDSSSDDDDNTTSVCVAPEPEVRVPDPQSVNLFVLIYDTVNITALNALLTDPAVNALLGTEQTRLVVLDRTGMVGLLPNACVTCERCDFPAFYGLPGASDLVALALADEGTFDCVLHADDVVPRRRLLIVADMPDDIDSGALAAALATPGVDVDLVCPGCDGATAGAPEAVASAGGLVWNSDIADGLLDALGFAALRPPYCDWVLTEDPPEPLTLADITFTIDVCTDAPCPVRHEQVAGIIDCDGDDPSERQFWIGEDFFSEGISLATLCGPACTSLRRVPAIDTRLTREYTCP
jgi:hypothetical protein